MRFVARQRVVIVVASMAATLADADADVKRDPQPTWALYARYADPVKGRRFRRGRIAAAPTSPRRYKRDTCAAHKPCFVTAIGSAQPSTRHAPEAFLLCAFVTARRALTRTTLSAFVANVNPDADAEPDPQRACWHL